MPCQLIVEILVGFVSAKTLLFFLLKTKPLLILYSVNYYEMILYR